MTAIKNKDSYFNQKYLNTQKGYKKAIVSISRITPVYIYHMILIREKFNPSEYKPF